MKPWMPLLIVVASAFSPSFLSEDAVMPLLGVVMMFSVVTMGLGFAEPNLREVAKSLNPDLEFPSYKSSFFRLIPWLIAAGLVCMIGLDDPLDAILPLTAVIGAAAMGWVLDEIATDLAHIAKALNKDADTTLDHEQPSALENIRRLRTFMRDDWK